MGTTVIGNPVQQRKANSGATWALVFILAALIVFGFIGWNRYPASTVPALDTQISP